MRQVEDKPCQKPLGFSHRSRLHGSGCHSDFNAIVNSLPPHHHQKKKKRNASTLMIKKLIICG